MTSWITDHDFKDRKSYIIKCPGTYKLQQNISFYSKHNKTSAIIIDSDNVILDLNGKELKQSKHDKHSQITGITVKTGHSHVTILGSYGSVRNFSQKGIYVEGGNEYVTIGDQTQLTVSGCGYGTPFALLDGSENITQFGIQIGEMAFLAKAGFGTYNGLVSHVKLSNVTSSQNNVGIALGEGSEYLFENCSFSNNYEYRILNNTIATLGGFIVENSVVIYGLVYLANPLLAPSYGIDNIVFENCTFNSNIADGLNPTKNVYPSGAYCDSLFLGVNVRGLKISGCQFNSNLTKLNTVSGYLNQTRGCVLASGSSTVIENSEFSNNLGGFWVNGLAISGLTPAQGSNKDNLPAHSTTIRNCVASNNKGVTNNPAQGLIQIFGFSIRYAGGLRLENCVAEDNIASLNYDGDTDVYIYAAGIFIYSSELYCDKFANNILVNNCKSSRNRVVKGKLGTSAGLRILDDLCENIVIENSVFTGNWFLFEDGDIPTDYDIIGSGIDLYNEKPIYTGPSMVSVLNNVVQSNGIFGIDTNLDFTNIQGNKVSNHYSGINLGFTDDKGNPVSTSCYSTVLDNTVLGGPGFGSVIGNGFGIFDVGDASHPTTNLVADNRVFNIVTPFNVFYPTPVPAQYSFNPNSYPALPTVSGSNYGIYNNNPCDKMYEECVLPIRGLNKQFDPKVTESVKEANLIQLRKYHQLKLNAINVKA